MSQHVLKNIAWICSSAVIQAIEHFTLDPIHLFSEYWCTFQGRLISLCSDNSLHLWEINNKDGSSVLEEVKSFSIENK